MPEYSILINKRIYRVKLIKKASKGLFKAKVNDKPVELEVEEQLKGSISPLAISVAGKKYQVELERIAKGTPVNLKVNNAPFTAQLREPVKRMAAPTPTAQVIHKAERRRRTVVKDGAVVAPMAGKVVSVKVEKGDPVNTGDVVCILEAMKMENEITATRTGRVQKVNVAEGTLVNEGDIIITID